MLSKLAHGGLQEVAGVSRMFGSAGRMQKLRILWKMDVISPAACVARAEP